ncbi:MAG TPA: OmpA family protein [Acidobacteriota bacterium]|nr:OmpA family protein [Acidobacteriota bacterium]
MIRYIRVVALIATLVAGAASPYAGTTDLLALHAGTLPVVEPAYYGGWPVVGLIDECPASGWASETGKVRDNVFVFELLAPATIQRFEFDTEGVDTPGSAARHVVVEISDTSSDTGFVEVLRAELQEGVNRQAFPAAKPAKGRWVRLSVEDNHGSEEWTELFAFRGFGELPAAPKGSGDISGTYESSYSLFHVRQQGTALAGCYEYKDGILEGAIEGRVMKIQWTEEGDGNAGPAILVFAPDGNSFRGFWWRGSDKEAAPAGNWDGRKVSPEVGGCPHWSGSVGGELRKDLAATGRSRLYGILFDIDSTAIRPESKPVLDEVIQLLKAEPAWRLTIEGHTDSAGDDAHNLKLSQGRAEAVKAYLAGQGIDAGRLEAKGLGESKPVADNATELGRARNRRVELVKE